VSATIDGDDVTACVASAVETAATTGQRSCFSFGSCRPAAPWIAPGEVLSISFEVSVPASFTALGVDPDCINDVTAEVYSENCSETPLAGDACSTGNASAEFDVVIPGIQCDKFVCADLDNDGDCDGDLVTDLEFPQETLSPFGVIYWVFVENTGEAALANVRVCDSQFLTDVETAALGLGICTLLDGGDGCSAPRNIAAGATEMYTCRAIAPSRNAWAIFAQQDPDGDPNCYTNTVEAGGPVDSSSICGPGGRGPSTDCSARVCVPPPSRGACCCKGRCFDTGGVCCTADVTEEECMEMAREEVCVYAGDGSSCNDDDGDGRPDACAQPIPTVSEWGLLILTLLFLTAAKLRFGSRPVVARG
jgi:hypothetical protein